ncbi:hypothetical protein SXCC_02461 [Gluconacetobacter sp. SXCC-1]|nr:hypothetical protein SXCC_02461 [Gluconacetobacter sp. SXCC-1]
MFLALSSVFVVFSCHLQGEPQKHFLRGFQNHTCYAFSFCKNLRQIYQSGNGKPCPTLPDCLHQSISLTQWQAADSVHFFSNNQLSWLKIGDHSHQFRSIRACARCFFSVDRSDVTSRCTGIFNDPLLSS